MGCILEPKKTESKAKKKRVNLLNRKSVGNNKEKDKLTKAKLRQKEDIYYYY